MKALAWLCYQVHWCIWSWSRPQYPSWNADQRHRWFQHVKEWESREPKNPYNECK